ncbi:hypothetical protein QAD02_001097 [Eretmocerus hayati]|uniref:Uncharacterized protein n=1 Tax=Eretmocerus hayati TaxID=131215 RepID=A0ACC2NG13_9HYME|nr:hypothetical protein QAD02_001097 [Eretmocerus hayati]
MRGSSVTAARSCLQPLVSASRYLAVQALSGDPFYFIVDVKSKVKEVYAQTCQLLGQQGMQDCELFGLAILSDGEYLFVDQECKLNKYAPKNWRSSHTYGLDSSGRPAFVLYFRVRYFVDTPLLLSDETTRHHYYLQLRDNVVRHGGGVESWQGRHPLQSGSVYGPLLSLAGLALQADLGDYNDERHRRQTAYCKPSDYLPAHMCHEDNALSVLAAQHRDNRGLSREEAELSYIKEALLLEAPLNAHLYRLRRSKSEQGPGRALLAICARGVRVYGDEDSPQVFTWNNIGKLGFDRKKFEIRAVDQPGKLTLFSGCDDKSKLLLALCRDTHQFFMAIAPRVTEAKRREEEERKVLRDCYMYPARCKLNMTSTRGSRADQRISVISSTSSNTTSGIVSDRVHSEDEPDGIGCVSASEESSSADLALALPQTTCNGSLLPTDLGSSTSSSLPMKANLTTMTTTTTTSLRQTLGSQCSSNCSTVVVTAVSGHNAGLNGVDMPGANGSTRRTSVGSSLELGYSHTAQNSAVSSDAAYDRCGGKSAKYAGTDVGSETSGIYTLRSSDLLDNQLANDSSVQSTTDEASVTSGFYTIHSGFDGSSSQEPIYSLCRDLDLTVNDRTLTNEDQTNLGLGNDDDMVVQRSRSNSILSTGSFRGDGSDPSNGQGPLLSADELSDLIVGRYPPRKSVGASMDSNCDYVQMPPPPAPPPRTDSCVQMRPPPPPYPEHGQMPPPPSYPRERFEIPPPTPPRNDAITPSSSLATVYTSQLARSQIEQYKQQMYSDVDYVMFPLKDPALSQQEYIDAKQGSLMAAMAAQPPPPPYPSLAAASKSSMMYRSTPYLSLSSYPSNQNLAASGSLSDTNSSNYLLYGGSQTQQQLAQPSQSQTQQHQKQASSSSTSQSQQQQDGMLDIKSLREKSRNLDLPLISALCNDRYLLKQTKAFVTPKHPSGSSANKTSSRSSNGGTESTSRHQKYPVSGSSNQLVGKPPRKPSSSGHKHPAGSASMAKAGSTIYQTANGSHQLSANEKSNSSRASLS